MGERARSPLSAFQLPRGRHGLPRQQVVESQRWRLLGATAEALLERGYARTRVEDIAARAAVSRRTVYERVGNLDACLLAAFEMTADCICDLAESACDSRGEWEAGLRGSLDEVLSFLATEKALAHLLGFEAVAGVESIAAAREQLLDRLAALGPERRSLEGALAVVSERVTAGKAAALPELAPQLAELIRGAE